MYSFDVPLNEWRANDAMKGTKQQYRERERGGGQNHIQNVTTEWQESE